MEVKFRYEFVHPDSGDRQIKHLDLNEIEMESWRGIHNWEKVGYRLNSRNPFIGKDKNGKEIYVGNKVECIWYSYEAPERAVTGNVVFDENLLCFSVASDGQMHQLNAGGYYLLEIKVLEDGRDTDGTN